MILVRSHVTIVATKYIMPESGILHAIIINDVDEQQDDKLSSEHVLHESQVNLLHRDW